jgi:hypothetical protein
VATTLTRVSRCALAKGTSGGAERRVESQAIAPNAATADAIQIHRFIVIPYGRMALGRAAGPVAAKLRIKHFDASVFSERK